MGRSRERAMKLAKKPIPSFVSLALVKLGATPRVAVDAN
jgi:hypothetical protein